MNDYPFKIIEKRGWESTFEVILDEKVIGEVSLRLGESFYSGDWEILIGEVNGQPVYDGSYETREEAALEIYQDRKK